MMVIVSSHNEDIRTNTQKNNYKNYKNELQIGTTQNFYDNFYDGVLLHDDNEWIVKYDSN